MTRPSWIAGAVLAVSFGAQVNVAHACACCASEGYRFVERVELGSSERELLASVAFASTAEVSMGEQDFADLKGIRIRSLPLDTKVKATGRKLTFTFDDRSGNTGHLVFAVPKSVTKFEVDPHDPSAKSDGGGPLLYKEWRLSAAAEGDGLLSGSVGGDQTATLILHGRGNACTDASSFNAWSLVLHGSRSQVTLFGDLVAQ